MRALVLSGGGSKGAWQLGILKKWMKEQKRDYQILAGVSVGALTVAGLAQFPLGQPEEAIDNVIKLWLEKVETKNVYRRWYPFGRLHALWLKSVYDSQPLIDLVHQNFSHQKVLESGKQVAVGAVCLNDGEHRYVRESDPHFVDWVLASSSFPIFLKPVEIEGRLWSDGGIKSVTPLGQAIKMGADEIDVLITSDMWALHKWSSKKKRAIPDQIVRTLSLMNDKIMQDDIKLTCLKNDLATVNSKYRRVRIRVVTPSQNLMDDSLDFNPKDIRRMMDIGYRDADEYVVYGT